MASSPSPLAGSIPALCRALSAAHSATVKLEMKQYFLAYLDSGALQGLQPFVVSSLVQLLARTIKLGWFEADGQRSIVDDCRSFLARGTKEHYLLGLRILEVRREAQLQRSVLACACMRCAAALRLLPPQQARPPLTANRPRCRPTPRCHNRRWWAT